MYHKQHMEGRGKLYAYHFQVILKAAFKNNMPYNKFQGQTKVSLAKSRMLYLMNTSQFAM